MNEIKIIKDKISLEYLQLIASKRFGDMVKAVVDIKKEMMAIGGEMHADEEAVLLENNSQQENLWGINLYPADFDTSNFIEYDSMINIRPGQNNRSRDIEDDEICQKIVKIVQKLIIK